jgi:hypothetical protein
MRFSKTDGTTMETYTAICVKTVNHIFKFRPRHDMIHICKLYKSPVPYVNVLILS